jgi:D-alanyl-D-alanine carboxypeptidase
MRPALLLLCLFAVLLALPAEAKKQRAQSGYCALAQRCAYLVIDANSGTVLEQREPDKQIYPASLTKLMTAYMLFEAIESGKVRLSDRVVVSRHAEAQPALKMGWRAGQMVTLEDALEAITVKSANDASVVIAEALGGSESAFARQMTLKAHQIGMNRTTFRNASGLPDNGQVSTARDMVELARHVLTDHPRYRRYFGLTEARVAGSVIEGHNNLTKNGVIEGGKTGYIRVSGFNMVAWSEENGRLILSSIFGGRSAAARDTQLTALLRSSATKLRKLNLGEGVNMASATTTTRLPTPKPQSMDELIESTGAGSAAPAEPLPAGVVEADIKTLIAASAPTFSTSWAIQIGAYKDELQAHQALQAATRKVPAILGPAYPRAVPTSTTVGELYRAQIIGLDEQQAKTACATLTRQGMQCLPMAPSG